jgi:hypothetical protein
MALNINLIKVNARGLIETEVIYRGQSRDIFCSPPAPRTRTFPSYRAKHEILIRRVKIFIFLI